MQEYVVETGTPYSTCIATFSVYEDKIYVTTPYLNEDEGDLDIFLQKFSLDGELLQTDSFGHFESDLIALDHAHLEDGELIITGISDLYNNNDAYTACFDTKFDLLWEWFDGGAEYERSRYITRDLDNGVLVGCFTAEDKPGEVDNKNHGDGYVVKLDEMEGAELWRLEFGTIDDDCECGIIPSQYDLGKYIVWGCDGLSFDGEVETDEGEDQLYWIAKVDSTGTVYWKKEFSEMTQEISRVWEYPANGDLVACGSNADESNDPAFYGWVAKVSSEGDAVFEKTFYYSDIVSYTELSTSNFFEDILILTDGTLLATGTYQLRNAFTDEYDGRKAWLLKLNENGCIGSTYCSGFNHLTTGDVLSSIEAPLTITSETGIFFDHSMIGGKPTINIQGLAPTQEVRLEIYSLQGKQLAVYDISPTTGSRITLDRTRFSQGVYIATIRDRESGQLLHSDRLLMPY